MGNQHYVVFNNMCENGTWKINTMLYVIHVKAAHGKSTLVYIVI